MACLQQNNKMCSLEIMAIIKMATTIEPGTKSETYKAAKATHNKESIGRQEYVKKYRENNKEKLAEGSRRYYEDNKEKLAEGSRMYYEDNKEKIAEDKKKYYEDNKEKIAEGRKKYYGDNKERITEGKKKYYEDNKEKLVEGSRKYYGDNKERIAEAGRRYYEDNKEKVKEDHKKWRFANPGKANSYTAGRRASKLRQTPAWVDKEELYKISLLYTEAKRLTIETDVVHHVDHYYPLKSSKGSGFHCLANLRIIKASENLSKSNKWPKD